MRQIGADCEIPVQPGEAQDRPCDETPADSEEAAKNTDKKSGRRQVDRADVRSGNWKNHGFTRSGLESGGSEKWSDFQGERPDRRSIKSLVRRRDIDDEFRADTTIVPGNGAPGKSRR